MAKKSWLIFVLFMFSITFYSSLAAPPTPFTSGNVEGIEIKYPFMDYIKVNDDMKLHFHLFNTSSGFPILNDSTECFFHLYNNTNHLVTQNNIRELHDEFDFEVQVNGLYNFSKTGLYSYIFQCNSSTSGGFVSEYFYVTNTGEEIPQNYFLSVILFGSLFAILLIYGGIYLLIKVKDD